MDTVYYVHDGIGRIRYRFRKESSVFELNEIEKGRGITTMHSILLLITVKTVKNSEKRHNRNRIVIALNGILTGR